MIKDINQVFLSSPKMSIDDSSKIVIMSDCHRGTALSFDNFISNEEIYKSALMYYYSKDFTYIELGDGDEMWEVDNYQEIIKTYIDIFRKLKKFYDEKRLIMIYGNHDILKRSKAFLEKYFYKYYDHKTNKSEALLDGLEVNESLILNYKDYDIFLIHGHQMDIMNSKFWRISRFLVKNIWRPLETMGASDPTGLAKNNKTKKIIEKRMKKWSIKNNKILIAGHTHRAVFPKIGESLYFNDGSCVHPNGITCLEIEDGCISLVKWEQESINKVMISKRKVIKGKEKIANFYNKYK